MQTSFVWRFSEAGTHEITNSAPKCSWCGKTYQKSILARILNSGNVETYQACPHCMTKLDDISTPKALEKKREPSSKMAKQEIPAESDGECVHYFGYLNKRPKGTSVPDPCLTCIKIVDCLYG